MISPEAQEGAVFRVGIVVRTTRSLYWMHRGERLTIPAGTRGVGEMDATRHFGLRFDGHAHPEYGVFPKRISLGKPIGDAFRLEDW